MTAEESGAEQHRLLQTAGVIETALFLADQLGGLDMSEMTKTHLDAAGQMVSNREFADLAGNAAGDALNDDSARQLSRRAVSYGIVMLTIEGAADAANPDVQPPLSEQMRATARERYGERVDQQLAAIPVFPFGKA